MNSYTSTQLATFTKIPSFTQSSTSTFSQNPSFSLSSSINQSPSFSPSPSFSLNPSVSQCPSLPQCPSITSPTFSLTPRFIQNSIQDTRIISTLTDNAFYGIVIAIIVIFIINLSYSIHYYNAYKNEKIRKLVQVQVQANPYHSSVRDTFNRV
jgi:hypothetical protein